MDSEKEEVPVGDDIIARYTHVWVVLMVLGRTSVRIHGP